VVEVEAGCLTSYHGDYEYYLAKKEGTAITSSAPIPDSRFPIPASKEDRLRQRGDDKQRQKEERARQKRLTEVEAAVEQAEASLKAIEEKLADPLMSSDYAALQKLGEEHGAAETKLAALYEEWEQLQD
jgi:ATP-binding cassette subfamily F protein 3